MIYPVPRSQRPAASRTETLNNALECTRTRHFLEKILFFSGEGPRGEGYLSPYPFQLLSQFQTTSDAPARTGADTNIANNRDAVSIHSIYTYSYSNV